MDERKHTECLRRLYDSMAEYIDTDRPTLAESLATLKTFHCLVLRELIVNSDLSPQEKIAATSGYLMVLAEDAIAIKNSLVKEIQ
jgi:hypothetical protein